MATNQMAVQQKNIAEQVSARVREFQDKKEIDFPHNYSPENAMKSAWLMLQTIKTGKNDGYRPALEVCTKESIANALLDMVVQGLNPAKKQGYFLVYGKQLVFQRSYFGTMAVTKRVTGAKSIDAQVIYEGDNVEYEIVNAKITNLVHKQQFGNLNKDKILGAYCTITLPGGEVYIEIMTLDELRKAWSKSQNWGSGTEERSGSVHDDFRQEMAKKTVINRACKKFLNSSDDASVMMRHVRGDEILDEEEVESEIQQNANGDIIDVDMGETEPEPYQDIIDTFEESEPVTTKKDGVPF